MLNLTRRKGERIYIGDDIVISVHRISGGTVYLGIEAPKEIAIHREEIMDQCQPDNRGNK